MITLNAFLRKLPELVVDNLTFHRNAERSLYFIGNGVWRLRKVGYNEYAMEKRTKNQFSPHRGTWHTNTGTGDIQIINIRLSFRGIEVLLGEDATNHIGD